MMKLEKATETTKKVEQIREVRILFWAIGVPMLIALLAIGGAVIWDGVVAIIKVIVPSGWVLLTNAYVAFIFLLIGRMSVKKAKNKEKQAK